MKYALWTSKMNRKKKGKSQKEIDKFYSTKQIYS